MKGMEEIFENSLIDSWVQHFARTPRQINKPHVADAELVEMPGDLNSHLAVTIDTVAEEISTGVYQDPYTMGWVTVMACVSDLAAVGAAPLGLVISVSVEPSWDRAFTDRLAQGMEDACRTAGTFILGGDTNTISRASLTGCAFGLVPRDNVMTRRGCKPADEVFITGGAGLGNAMGLVRSQKLPEDCFPEKLYRPTARIAEGQVLSKYASCCMDTSDGLLATLDQLMRLNSVGFEIDCDWERILVPEVLELCHKTGTPPWLMVAGPHGEFELVFTLSSEVVDELTAQPEFRGSNPIRLGRVQEKPAVSLALPSGQTIDVNIAPLRNLLQTVESDLERYAKEFRSLGKTLGLE